LLGRKDVSVFLFESVLNSLSNETINDFDKSTRVVNVRVVIRVLNHEQLRLARFEKLTLFDDRISASRAKHVTISKADANRERYVFSAEPVV